MREPVHAAFFAAGRRQANLTPRFGDEVLGLIVGVSSFTEDPGYAADVAQAVASGFGHGFHFAFAVLPRKSRRFGVQIEGILAEKGVFISLS